MSKAIHVWYDAPAAEDRGVDTYYSVSEVDEDGDEIRSWDSVTGATVEYTISDAGVEPY